MKPLFNEVYLSKSRLSVSKHTIEEGVKNILNSANKNNPVLGITGALLYILAAIFVRSSKAKQTR